MPCLLAEGPSSRALVPGPLHVGMSDGLIVRFEEVTRCPPEIQDVLISIISEKLMMVPELVGESRVLMAQPGFNMIATANIRDRGVHEMSSALKRRFNFETVHPIGELAQEITLVSEQCTQLLSEADAEVKIGRDVVEVLVTAFHDLREGVTADGVQVEKPTTVMSTAEAVSVAFQAALDAFYYGDRKTLAGAHRPAPCGSGHQGQSRRSEETQALLRHRRSATQQGQRRAMGGTWESAEVAALSRARRPFATDRLLPGAASQPGVRLARGPPHPGVASGKRADRRPPRRHAAAAAPDPRANADYRSLSIRPTFASGRVPCPIARPPIIPFANSRPSWLPSERAWKWGRRSASST